MLTRIAILCVLLVNPLMAQQTGHPRRQARHQANETGIVGEKAPTWGVTKWLNLPPGQETLDITDYHGKVLYLYGFQSWCPGCHSHGFPTMLKLMQAFQHQEDVAFVAVQTVFEGFPYNTFDHAQRVAKRYKLDIPVGQSGENGRRSEIMKHYRTGGTPWTMVIDRQGIVRFNDFRTTPAAATQLIRELLKEPKPRAHSDAAPDTITPSRSGHDLLGKTPELDALEWIEPLPPTPRPRATLIRWFTDGCDFCAFSMPAISGLREAYAARGLQTVAVYHPKPAGPTTADHARHTARSLSYDGPLAMDPEWTALKHNYLNAHPDATTSITLILDAAGLVQYVHPGPIFGPSPDPALSDANRDYDEIRQAIEALLGA